MNSDRRDRRFGEEFVMETRLKYGKRPKEQRSLTYDIAVNDEFSLWRDWYDEQLEALPSAIAETFARRMWLDENFWPCTFELAVGAGLRRAGCLVAYERTFNGVTPDWTVLSENDRPLSFVEVHTDQPPRETFGHIRAWQGLDRRISDIPVPFFVMLENPESYPVPPSSAAVKKIARDLRLNLLRLQPELRVASQGYTFRLAADNARNKSIRARFISPSGIAGPIEAESALLRVSSKVTKYRELAKRYSAPLVVAVGAHRFTGLTLERVDDLIEGRQSIVFQFSSGDQYIGEKSVTLGSPARWMMPSDLAALVWVSHEYPFNMEVRRNPNATRTLPTNWPLAAPG